MFILKDSKPLLSKFSSLFNFNKVNFSFFQQNLLSLCKDTHFHPDMKPIQIKGLYYLPNFLTEKEEQLLLEDLRYILTASGKKISKDFIGTPLARAGSFGLKRNALIVVANKKLNSLKNEVEALVDHEKLGELAQWSLAKLNS